MPCQVVRSEGVGDLFVQEQVILVGTSCTAAASMHAAIATVDQSPLDHDAVTRPPECVRHLDRQIIDEGLRTRGALRLDEQYARVGDHLTFPSTFY